LQAVHQIMFGSEHPVANCQHLRRKIAWHLQAKREGGLPESVQQRALAIARDEALHVRIDGSLSRRPKSIPANRVTSTVIQTRDARLPMPGCLIVKKYKDRTLVVKVLHSGFEHEGRHYSSLSQIATEVTGTRWNGFAFFGLDKELQRAS
jgi:hypothetical protein